MRSRLAFPLALALLAAPLVAEAQQAAKVARVGVLVNRPGDADEFRQAFGELGWAVGQNIVFEIRVAEDRFERFPGLAREPVDLNVDVIMTIATPATLAAMKHSSTPIRASGDTLVDEVSRTQWRTECA